LAATGRGTAICVVKPATKAAKPAESTKPAKPAATTAARALLAVNCHRGAQEKNQNPAGKFLETVCFHNLPFH